METEKDMPKEDLVDISEHKVSRSAEVLLFHIREAGSDKITGSQDNTAKIYDNSSERLVPDNAPVSTEEESTSAEAESTSDGSSQTLLSESNALKIERLQCLKDLLEKKKLAISLLGKAQEYEKENPARERLDVLELNQYKVEYIDGVLVPAKRIEFLVTPSRRHLSKRLQTEFIIALLLETERFELILNELRSAIGTKLF